MPFLTDKLRKAFANLPHLSRALRLVREAAPRHTLIWLIILVVQGLLPAAVVYLTRALVNSLVAVIESGGDWAALRPALLLALLMGAILLVQELLNGVSSWVRMAQGELVQDHVSALIHRQSMALDMAFYDSSEYYDHLHRARREASHRPLALLENLGGLLQNGITLAAMMVVLLPYGWWLPLALLLSTLPALWIVVQYGIQEHEWRLRATEDERRVWYYDFLITARQIAAELRLFDTGPHFQARYQALRKKLRQERLDLLRRQAVARLLAGAGALLVMGLSMAWMVWRALQGALTLGDLALIYSAFNQGQKLMRTLLENVGQIYRNMLFLGDLFEFLDLEPTVREAADAQPTPALLREGIRFRDVTFRYPENERIALDGFDLAIPASQITAIVGPNGAGKTTLLKLLCRFYDPQAGAIELDGTDLRRFSLSTLRRAITVLFQNPVPYQDTAFRNVTLGDLSAEPDTGAVQAAAIAAGASSIVDRLPQGWETLLGKWFKGGTDLSVGEWQRMALARAFLHQAAIIILDEPTSAMDPWAETDWLARFRTLAEGRTAIIITHRFTTAMHADVIHVMDEGRVVESGSHGELLALDGRYAQSWRAQMRSRKRR